DDLAAAALFVAMQCDVGQDINPWVRHFVREYGIRAPQLLRRMTYLFGSIVP
ncbi:hypothetical protein SARC_14577, partial [Sphaeroforma arctica JP610]